MEEKRDIYWLKDEMFYYLENSREEIEKSLDLIWAFVKMAGYKNANSSITLLDIIKNNHLESEVAEKN